MPPRLPESSSSAHEHVGGWCLFREGGAFRALVRVEEATARRDMVVATLRVIDVAPRSPEAPHIPVGRCFEVSASRTCWNQIWTLFPLPASDLQGARAALRESFPEANRWHWICSDETG